MVCRFILPFFNDYGLLFFLFLGSSCTPLHREPPPLRIATAANVQFAMDEIVQAFTEQTQIPCEMIIGSSGKLTAQILQGAPYDVFLSANMKYPEELYEAGYAFQAPKVYAHGKLILWALDPNIPLQLDQLNAPEIKHIALANPRNAPYGLAAMEVLEASAKFAALEPKLVYGESISQCNQFVLSGGAQIGFTAKAIALSPQLRDRGSWIELADSLYTPIAQGVVVIKPNKREDPNSDAQAFYEFLFSEEVAGMLEEYGYYIKK